MIISLKNVAKQLGFPVINRNHRGRRDGREEEETRQAEAELFEEGSSGEETDEDLKHRIKEGILQNISECCNISSFYGTTKSEI